MLNESEQTVLVVEDDDDIRNTVALALELEGYRVCLASNGLEALTITRTRNDIGLIFLDLMMPVMDGRKFIEEYRNDGLATRVPRVPIVVLTAAGERQCPEGARELVNKPLDLDSLLTTTRRYVHCETTVST